MFAKITIMSADVESVQSWYRSDHVGHDTPHTVHSVHHGKVFGPSCRPGGHQEIWSCWAGDVPGGTSQYKVDIKSM